MKKLDFLKKRKWLRDRKRSKKVRKQNNYKSKTHKGTDKSYLQENLKKEEED